MHLYALAFSPTGNTKKVVMHLTQLISKWLHIPWSYSSLDTPQDREKDYTFQPNDVVIVGGPTYAGKLPNKILPYYQQHLHGQQTPAISLVTFGNRSFDNSLAELSTTLADNNFRVLAAGAFAAEHAFCELPPPTANA